MSNLNQSSLGDGLTLPVAVRYNQSNIDVHKLVESDNIHNESLIVTSCRYHNDDTDPVIIISDSDKELASEIGQSVIYQFKEDTNSNRSGDPQIDYYSYLENNKIIPLNLPSDISSVELIDNLTNPEDANVVLTCDIPYIEDLSDCPRLLIISENNSDDFNIITEVHKMSGTPHLSYHNDIIDKGKMTEIVRSELYSTDNDYITDNRNSNIFGLLTGDNLW